MTCAYFGTHGEAPLLHRLLSTQSAVGFVLPPLLIVVDPFLVMVALSLYALIVCLSVISIGLWFWSRGYRAARNFLLAWLVLFAAVAVLALVNFGLMPLSPLAHAGPYVGILLMVLLLSVAQADRINMLRADAEQAGLALRENESRLAGLVDERTAELIDARDQAEAASRSKSQFLANVSHELRTPMNAVLGFTSLLHQQSQGLAHQGYLSAIESAGKTLLTLIGDILDLSKVESGKLDLSMGPVDLRVLAAGLGQMFAGPAADRGMRFGTDVEQGVPAWIEVDEVRLRQILVNLIGNAVKYAERGRIDLRISA